MSRLLKSAPRLLDDAEALCAVLLAVGFAHFAHARHTGWAAFSGYMVMRSRLSESLPRGVRRIVGTVAGAVLAWCVAAYAPAFNWVQSLALAAMGGITIYCAITRRHGYSWLFTGITFGMVLLDTSGAPADDATQFAASRVIEVISGTVACLFVGVLSEYTLRPLILGGRSPTAAPSTDAPWNREVAVHACVTAAALAVLPFLSHWASNELLSQAAVTVLAVMMVPMAAVTDGRSVVSRRIVHRVAGCLLGAALAAVGLALTGTNIVAIVVFLSIGVLLGRHVENGGGKFAYVGTQFVLAFLVVFAPDSYSSMSLSPGLHRLAGIGVGMVVLQLVRLLGKALQRRLAARSKP